RSRLPTWRPTMATAKPTRNEAHEHAGADPRAVCAGPPRPCAVGAGASHPRAVSAVSAGPPHLRAVSPLGDVQVPERQRAFDAVRGPPLKKPRVVTASGHAGAADTR